MDYLPERKNPIRNIRNDILEKIEDVVAPIVSTLGPAGRRVLIDHPGGFLSTNDGYTVAYHLRGLSQGADDRLLASVANIVCDAAAKTNLEVGDGTTSTAYLLSIFANKAMFLDKDQLLELDRSVNEAYLEEASCELTAEEVYKISLVASKSASVASVLSDIHSEGVSLDSVSVVPSDTPGIKQEDQIGFIVDLTRDHTLSLSSESSTLTKEEEAVTAVITFPGEIKTKETFFALSQFLEKAGITRGFVVCAGVTHEFAGLCMDLKNQKGVFLIPVVPEAKGQQLSHIIADACAVLNSSSVPGLSGFMFGKASKYSISTRRFVFVPEDIAGAEKRAKSVVPALEAEIAEHSNSFIQQELRARISRLLLRNKRLLVGAGTDIERGDLLLRVEDSIRAVRAAMKTGYIVGGGDPFRAIKTENLVLQEVFSEMADGIRLHVPDSFWAEKEKGLVIEPRGNVNSIIRNAWSAAKVLCDIVYLLSSK